MRRTLCLRAKLLPGAARLINSYRVAPVSHIVCALWKSRGKNTESERAISQKIASRNIKEDPLLNFLNWELLSLRYIHISQ